jgi:hypothetical protein
MKINFKKHFDRVHYGPLHILQSITLDSVWKTLVESQNEFQLLSDTWP